MLLANEGHSGRPVLFLWHDWKNLGSTITRTLIRQRSTGQILQSPKLHQNDIY